MIFSTTKQIYLIFKSAFFSLKMVKTNELSFFSKVIYLDDVLSFLFYIFLMLQSKYVLFDKNMFMDKRYISPSMLQKVRKWGVK